MKCNNHALGDAGAEALWRAEFPCLEELSLAGCGLCPVGARSLAHVVIQGFLRKLVMYCNALGPEGVAALLAAPLPALEELYLWKNGIGEEGAAEIAAASPRLPRLRILHAGHNALGDGGARALAQAHFPQLESLDLSSNEIGAEGEAALAVARLRWPTIQDMFIS